MTFEATNENRKRTGHIFVQGLTLLKASLIRTNYTQK